MIVYGKYPERVATRAWVSRIAERCDRIRDLSPGIARHGELVSAFIDAAGLAQGVADELFRREGVDRRSAEQDACMALLLRLASAVRTSWNSRFAAIPPLPDRIEIERLPEKIETYRPEGYAHYAVYPEAFIEAARRWCPAGPVRVIGIRSIGTGLAALVAVELRCGAPITVRPTGHPFARRLCIDATLAAELTADPQASYIVVDEGPGLSGSSFASVADFLAAHGVPLARVTFLTSHGDDPGAEAWAGVRLIWSEVRREVADSDTLLEEHIGAWAELALHEPCRGGADLSGGAWRALFWKQEGHWPAVNPSWERRKFLMAGRDANWLLKFAGLGSLGERKLARARVLAAAGFGPEARGLVQGLLATRWLGDARPLQPGHPDRTELTARAGDYIGFLAKRFPVANGRGADISELLQMARCNTAEALGEAAAAGLDRWRSQIDRLRTLVEPAEIDGRMLPHEWLRTASGELVKTDALDHHAAHDLIGCQDPAWDVVGAALELGISQDAVAAAASAAAGRRIAPELLAFYRPCYLAFRWAQHRMAAQSLGAWPAEAGRNARAADHYARLLAHEITGEMPKEVDAALDRL